MTKQNWLMLVKQMVQRGGRSLELHVEKLWCLNNLLKISNLLDGFRHSEHIIEVEEDFRNVKEDEVTDYREDEDECEVNLLFDFLP